MKKILVIGAQVKFRADRSGSRFTITYIYPNRRCSLKGVNGESKMIVGLDEIVSSDDALYTSVGCATGMPWKVCSCPACQAESRQGRI